MIGVRVATLRVIAGISLTAFGLTASVEAQTKRVVAVPVINPNQPVGPAFRPMPTVAAAPPATNLDLLNQRVFDLEKKLVAQQAQIDLLRQSEGAPVRGYSRGFYTLGAFKTLPDTYGVLVYARK